MADVGGGGAPPTQKGRAGATIFMLFHTMGARARRAFAGRAFGAAGAASGLILSAGVGAAQIVGAPRPNQMGLPEPATPDRRGDELLP